MLNGWKGIAKRLNRSVITVLKWHKKRPMPIQRTPGGGVYVMVDELDAWLRQG